MRLASLALSLFLAPAALSAAPSAVADLSAAADAQIVLTWTAPNPHANLYDIRWSTVGPINNDADFNASTSVPLGTTVAGWALRPTSPKDPKAPGAAESLVVTGLKPRQKFYWAVKSSADGGSTWSPLDSNAIRAQAVSGSFALAASGYRQSSGDPAASTVGDFDGDGRPDVFVTDSASGKANGVFRNAGAFSLTTEPGWTAAEGTLDAVWADMDNDGLLDIVEANNASNSQPVKVLRNNGDGTFATVWTLSQSSAALSVAAADFDNDGRKDILVLFSAGRVQLYRNLGGFNFAPVWTSTETTLSGQLAVGDYDNDGRLDFAVAAGFQTYVFRNLGNGSFSHGWSSPSVSNSVHSVGWDDYNNDGHIDLVMGFGVNLNAYQNDGSGSFFQTWTGTGGIGDFQFGDYDGDGRVDLLVSATQKAQVLRNLGGGTFATPVPAVTPNNGNLEYVSFGDFDGDGAIDIANANNSAASGLQLFRNEEADFGSLVSTPTPPAGLSGALLSGGTVQLSWAGGAYESGASSNSLYYQVAVATCASNPCLGLDPSGTLITSPGRFVVSPAYGSTLLGDTLRPMLADGQPGLRLYFAGIAENATYYFRVATIDSGLRRSSWSAEASIYVSEAPAAVNNLSTAAVILSDTQASLSWTATGDNAYVGAAASYDIRYSSLGAITAGNFAQADVWNSARAATGPSGTAEAETISGLAPGATYYFALRVRDAAGNLSSVSNSPSYLTGKDVVAAVTSVAPADGTYGVPASTAVTLSFTKSLSTASVAAAFSLTAIQDNAGNAISLGVPGTFSFSGRTAVFTPLSPLAKNHLFQVALSTAAVDPIGNAIASSATARFTTVFDHTAVNVIRTASGLSFTVPAGAFAQDGSISISTNAQNPSFQAATQKLLTQDDFRRPVRTFQASAADVSANPLEPSAPVTATVPYTDADGDGIVDGSNPPVRASTLALWWLDEASQNWVRLPGATLDAVGRTVTSPVPHFSYFALIGGEDTSLADAFAYPVPYVPSRQSARAITFQNLSSVATIKIFTVSGTLVRTINVNDGTGKASWDVKNGSGRDVASGVYLYLISNERETKSGKLIIVR